MIYIKQFHFYLKKKLTKKHKGNRIKCSELIEKWKANDPIWHKIKAYKGLIVDW